jgi:hypothetical protein
VDALSVVVLVWCGHAVLRLLGAIATNSLRGANYRFWLRVAILQLGALLGLGAYVWLVIGAPSEKFVVTTKGVDIHGEYYRALRIEPPSREQVPPRPKAAWLERCVGTTTDELRVERARWWSSRTGRYKLALARVSLAADGAVFRHGNQQVTLKADKPVKLGLETLLLRAIRHYRHEHSEQSKQAELEISGKPTLLSLDPEWAGESAFLGMKESPVLLLRVHRNLGLALAVLATMLLLVGGLLVRLQARWSSREL